MRQILIVISLVVGGFLIHKTLINWDDIKQYKVSNADLRKQINQIATAIEDLEGLEDKPLQELQDGYKRINTKIRLFARSHDLKISLDLNKLNKKGFLWELEENSKWIGVKQMNVDIKFFDIKEFDQFITIIGFLDTLEASNYLKVMSIYQASDALQAKVQIYGRGL